VVTKERRFHIYEVLLQDVLDGTNIAHPKMVIVEESHELEDVFIFGHPFSLILLLLI